MKREAKGTHTVNMDAQKDFVLLFLNFKVFLNLFIAVIITRHAIYGAEVKIDAVG